MLDKVSAMLKERPALARCEDTRGNTALLLALVLRRVDVVALLVANDCDVMKRNRDGNSALHFLGEV